MFLHLLVDIIVLFQIMILPNGTSFIPFVGQDSAGMPQIELINKTFLGNEERNYYGNRLPDSLALIWKYKLGTGITIVGKDTLKWSGAGWTGQPLMFRQDTTLYILQGAYDHRVHKILASNADAVWQYSFDDVIKGTGTLYLNDSARTDSEKLILMQGSRQGVGLSLYANVIPSYRAISALTGEEFWRLNSKKTLSYSRDVDGSCLVINDTAYIGLENGVFTVFNPNPGAARNISGILQPEILDQDTLYDVRDAKLHRGNLVTESSGARLGNRIYIASGSGHIYGYNLQSNRIDWDYFIGSDMDGSVVITEDSCLLVSVEKEYIPGNGGIFKLDPSKHPNEAVVWFFPTGDKIFAKWKGGVIGSASTNKQYTHAEGEQLVCFTALDGYFYVVSLTQLADNMVNGPNLKRQYQTPKLIFSYKTGQSISTPIIVNDKIAVAGYYGIYLFDIKPGLEISKIAHFPGNYESTPFAHNGRLYIAARDGYLYCLGNK